MILTDKLKEIVAAQKQSIPVSENLVVRSKEASVDFSLGHAIVISGIRRCGKSTMLLHMMNSTGQSNYFNFEDPRAAAFEVSDFERLEAVFAETSNNSNFYFFDEIQNIDNWEKYIRNALDRKNKIFITGSNASLLSKELGSRLTGRHIRYELFPFSYNEMLAFLGLPPGIESFYIYLEHGGFPEYIKTRNIKILQELFNDIIARDIVIRHGVRNAREIKDLALYLLSNVGKEFSYNSLMRLFNLGSVNSIISYVSYFEDCYLLFTVPRFEYSLKKQITNPKKVYAIDPGLINAVTLSYSSDKGRILENIVFISLRKDEKEIFYFKAKHECDFVVKDRTKIVMAIQVCYELNDSNQQRELDGLYEAMQEYALSEGFIVTYNQDDTVVYKEKKITIIPAWKWLRGS